MKPNHSITRSVSVWLTHALVLTAALCFFPRLAPAQKPVEVDPSRSNPPRSISQEDFEKLPKREIDLEKLLPTGPPPPTPKPNVLPNPAPGHSASIRTPPGLITVVFTTPEKDTLEIYFPNQMSMGNGYTATMKLKLKAGGSTDALKDYTVQIDGEQLALVDGTFSVNIPEVAKNTSLVNLVDKDGRKVAGVSLPVAQHIPIPESTTSPTSGTAGQLLEFTCPCKGITGANDFVKINGVNMPILASGPGTVVALNTSNFPGITEMQTRFGGTGTKTEFRNLTLKVWADKLHLLQGEGTVVHIVVGGLENLKGPARMTVDARGVVNMGGGNSQKLNIDPSMVAADGTYTTAESLTALAEGSFGVDVTVTVDDKKK
ncbi:MAG: hypothetical protein AABM67_10890 [Acidobacteriota bacterium]